MLKLKKNNSGAKRLIQISNTRSRERKKKTTKYSLTADAHKSSKNIEGGTNDVKRRKSQNEGHKNIGGPFYKIYWPRAHNARILCTPGSLGTMLQILADLHVRETEYQAMKRMEGARVKLQSFLSTEHQLSS